MGLFGYAFISLSKDQVHARRLVLDRYALVAQLSAIIVLLAISLCRLASWLRRRYGKGDEEQTPSSPYLKAGLENDKASWPKWLSRRISWAQWWLGEDVPFGMGNRAEWFYGSLWLCWLLILCINDTGEDYMHLTKRFGIIAASQLPLHFLIAIKSPCSPIQLLTSMSHEQLNSAHKVLGRLMQLLLALHGIFYINFFVRMNVMSKRIKDKDVALGLVCLMIITTITTTALPTIRKWNYRAFYSLHVILGVAFLPLAYFHVHHIRQYILEGAAVYLTHIILRFIDTRTLQGSISPVAGTTLVKVDIPLTKSQGGFRPGQHVYLYLPATSNSKLPRVFLRNPFTVASLPQRDQRLVLIARTLRGNTTHLSRIARAHDSHNSTPVLYPLKVEGPYGAASHLPDLALFDRILLVAGGVGSTFIVPLWRNALSMQSNKGSLLGSEVRMIWAVRNILETSWALPISEAETHDDVDAVTSEAEVYVTGVGRGSQGHVDADGDLELDEIGQQDEMGAEKMVERQSLKVKRGRPDLHSIVVEVCSGHAGRIAILACGPSGMISQLRHEAKREALKGKDIFWHAEEFGL